MRGAQREKQLADQMSEATPRKSVRIGRPDKHDLGEAREGLKSSVARDTADASNAVDGPRQTRRKTSFGRPMDAITWLWPPPSMKGKIGMACGGRQRSVLGRLANVLAATCLGRGGRLQRPDSIRDRGVAQRSGHSAIMLHCNRKGGYTGA
jgi:hypothetical protein